jgi:hypothetical protein
VAPFILNIPQKSCTHFSSPYACYMRFTYHLPRLDYSNYTWRRVQITKLLVIQFLQPPVTSSLLSPNNLLSTLLSNNFSVVRMWTDVLEEHIASIFRVENRPSKKLTCSKWLGSETSVHIRTTRRCIQEDGNIHNSCCDNLKPHCWAPCPPLLILRQRLGG